MAQLPAGSFGRVYRGTWQGKRVAVKVVDDASKVQMRDGKPMEAALTEGLTHPAICRLYASNLRSHSRTSADAWGREHGPGRAPDEFWLLLEYCDKGSVQVRRRLSFMTPLPSSSIFAGLLVCDPPAAAFSCLILACACPPS